MQDQTATFFKWVVGVIVVLFLLAVAWGSFGTVAPNQTGVKTRFNAIVGTVQPGIFFKLPFIESVIKMDTGTRTVNYDKNGNEGDSRDTSQLSGASRDLQDVWIGVVVNYHVNAASVGEIYAKYKTNDNFEYNVVEPIIREVVKTTSALYTAEELVTKRAEYGDKVNSTLKARLEDKGATLERFSITNFEFSQSFTQAIEAKVTAVQNAEAAKNKLEQVKAEAQQTIESAKAQAEAIRIQAAAVNSQGGADYVELQRIKMWDGHACTSYCGLQASTGLLVQGK